MPCLIGALVALALGLYGRLHSPTGMALNIAGFSSPGYGEVVARHGRDGVRDRPGGFGPGDVREDPRVTAPDWIGGLHRWSGRIAFLLAVPVAIHCLYALGFQQYSTRVLLHSLFGCLFFGAFTVKMLILPKRDLPGWVLPVAGAVVFTALVAHLAHVRLLVLFHVRHQALRSRGMAESSDPRPAPRRPAGAPCWPAPAPRAPPCWPDAASTTPTTAG